MNTATQTITLNEGFLARRRPLDWLFALAVLAGGLFAFSRYAAHMDVYEKGILLGTLPAAIWLGWFWRPLQGLMAAVAGLSLLAVASYQDSLARADTVFWLKYFLSSQSAILWMSCSGWGRRGSQPSQYSTTRCRVDALSPPRSTGG